MAAKKKAAAPVGRQAAYSARNRAALIKHAQEVLAEVGPSATIEQLASHAQVSPTTIYKYFANKEVLLHHLDTIYTRARNISKENNEVRTDALYEEQLRTMISTYASNDIHVILQHFDGVSLKWNRETKIVVFRTLQELMVNMKIIGLNLFLMQ